MYRAREALQRVRKYQAQIRYVGMKDNFTYSPTNIPSALPRVPVTEINPPPPSSILVLFRCFLLFPNNYPSAFVTGSWNPINTAMDSNYSQNLVTSH